DGVRVGAGLLVGRPDLLPYLVVLSDGADTVSSASAPDAFGFARSAQAGVFSIAITGSGESDVPALRSLGQHFRIFYPAHLQEQRHPEHELEKALSDGRYQEEGWRIRKDGSHFWAHVTITAIFDETGEHFGFAKVTRDVTERRLADQGRDEFEKALADANASLESVNLKLTQAADDQSQFIAVTAHELRNPAAVLGGSAQTLANHWGDLTAEERSALLVGMTSSADRLHHLLSDLLTASSLEANSLKLSTTQIPLSRLLKSATDAARATHARAQIVVEPHPDIEVQADPIRLAQAVDNLIVNALSHGAEPVRIAVSADELMAEIRIRDAGQGVDPELLPRLFDRFATGARTTGTGLGLFIVRELARAHGGDAYYEVASDEHPSGAFVLTVPVA
ncbi:MAG: PAS domain-containing sensor histidine kinase, partial [Aeromicrobium sp.]